MPPRIALVVAEERGNRHVRLVGIGQLACACAAAGEYTESEALAGEVIREARLLEDPGALSLAVVCAVASYLTNRDTPEFERALGLLEANPIEWAFDGIFHWLERCWGLAHFGLAHTSEAIRQLVKSLRGFERSQPGLAKDATLALAVALHEAGQHMLAATMCGYADANFVIHTLRDLSYKWLSERLDAAEASLDPAEVAAARQSGSRLNRRGFMALLGEAEQAAETASVASAVDFEEHLTGRQLEIAALVARGLTNKAIAERLDLSTYTVETHVRNILERLDATSRTQIATWWQTRPPN